MTAIIELHQERTPRPEGWQLTQWVDPTTTPDVLEALFVVRATGPLEALEGIATLPDCAALAVNPLACFEPRGTNGGALLAALPNDVLRITTVLPHWLQVDAPYDDMDFVVAGVASRVAGTGAALAVGGGLTLDGYAWTDEDLGRWVYLLGFATPGNNGFTQVIAVAGGAAVVDKVVAVGEASTGAWAFRWLVAYDRDFPTRRDGLAWALYRDAGLVTSGDNGSTRRADPGAARFRTARWTSVEASLDAALALAAVVRAGARRLQVDAGATAATVPVVITTTFGP